MEKNPWNFPALILSTIIFIKVNTILLRIDYLYDLGIKEGIIGKILNLLSYSLYRFSFLYFLYVIQLFYMKD